MDVQSCYTSAYEMRKKSPLKAVEMIEKCLCDCECSWLDRMRANLNLGLIYEEIREYKKAEEAFCESLNAVPENIKDKYKAEISINILRVCLHITDFSFSERLCELYTTAIKANALTLSMRQNLFYISLTEIIIAEHEKDNERIRNAINNALSALNKNKKTETDRLLKKHRYEDDANASDEALKFLRKHI